VSAELQPLPRPASLEVPKGRELIEAMLTVEGSIGETYSRFHRYSPRNLGFLALQGCPIEPVATFKRWQELGRQVQRGQKAYSILRPIQVKVENEKTEEVTMVRRFKVVRALFAVSQTAGEDLPPYEPPAWSRNRALQSLDITEVPFEHYDGNVQGYSYDRNLAVSPVAAYPFKTWAHEAGHILGGHTIPEKLLEYQEHRGVSEFEAEATAHLFLKTIGATDQFNESESRGYIQHYMRGQEPTERNYTTILNSTGRLVEAGYERGEE
jgi:hypothetical protein